MSEYETITIRCSKREALRFKGKLIAETEWTTKHDTTMRFEIWETQGGTLIPVIEGELPGEDAVKVSAEVVPPHPNPFEQQVAVMQFFEFHDRARSMVKKQLKWRLVREVA